MNLLEVYVTRILEEEVIDTGFGEMVRAKIDTHCYGVVNTVVQVFRPEEWEEVKQKGYYMG